MHMNRGLIGILVLGMLVLASVHVASATGEVTWYWKDVDYSNGHDFDKFMNTTEVPQTSTSNIVTLGSGERAWWYADEAAQCNLTFPAGDWIATYWVQAMNPVDKIRGYIQGLRLLTLKGKKPSQKRGGQQ